MAHGKFDVTLSQDTPLRILDMIDVTKRGIGLSHVVITPTHLELDAVTPAGLMAAARYTGVYRRQDEMRKLGGTGLAFWLGDEDGKGRSYGNLGLNGNFPTIIGQIRPPTLAAGTVSPMSGTYSKVMQRGVPLDALKHVCQVFGAEWRIRPNFTLDAGAVADLFKTNPTAVVVRRKGDGGRDVNLRGVVGDLGVRRDLESWANRVVQFTGSSTSHVGWSSPQTPTPVADVPYRSPDGTYAYHDAVYEEFGAEAGSENALAYGHYRDHQYPHDEFRVSTDEYDIGADVGVGDALHVYDPERGIYDMSQYEYYRGGPIFPRPVRCVGRTWSIRNGMGVYLRYYRPNGTATWDVKFLDLTRYVEWEDAATQLEVGAKPRGIV